MHVYSNSTFCAGVNHSTSGLPCYQTHRLQTVMHGTIGANSCTTLTGQVVVMQPATLIEYIVALCEGNIVVCFLRVKGENRINWCLCGCRYMNRPLSAVKPYSGVLFTQCRTCAVCTVHVNIAGWVAVHHRLTRVITAA